MLGLTIPFILSQLFAFFAIIGDIVSFQCKKKKYILICFIISASCISAHYFLLGRISAGSLLLIGIIRFFISLRSADIRWAYIFTFIYLLFTILFFKDIYDIVIFLALSLSTFATFQERDKILRLLFMIATTLSIIYNVLIFSPVGVLLEGIFLVSNLVGYWRFYIRNKSK